MPVSDINNIVPILHEVVRLRPKKMLELGVGVGKYGVLCREVLDGVRGLVRPKQSDDSTEIFGIEGFQQYSNPAWGAYDGVMIADFTEMMFELRGYDLVMMIDSLEHLDKAKAEKFLDFLVLMNKHVIISVPLGYCPQGAAFGNKFECHRSVWHGAHDFSNYNPKVLYQGVCLVVSLEGQG